jgi:hypothetical protein
MSSRGPHIIPLTNTIEENSLRFSSPRLWCPTLRMLFTIASSSPMLSPVLKHEPRLHSATCHSPTHCTRLRKACASGLSTASHSSAPLSYHRQVRGLRRPRGHFWSTGSRPSAPLCPADAQQRVWLPARRQNAVMGLFAYTQTPPLTSLSFLAIQQRLHQATHYEE